jgi:glutamyl/glutaminyl-tRNA synthetase
MGMAGGRLSKRTGATAISDYRRMGYLPQALVNYLLLLSWSPGANREVIDIAEAEKVFDIKAVNKTAAAFDLKKLEWMNNQYIKTADPEKLTDLIIPSLTEKGYVQPDKIDRNYIVSLVKLFQPRLALVNDFADWADFFFAEEVKIDPVAQEKYLRQDLSREFSLFAQRLQELKNFGLAEIEESFRGLVGELGIESKALIHPVRVALTGKTVGPGLFEVIYYLGRERSVKRLLRLCRPAGA